MAMFACLCSTLLEKQASSTQVILTLEVGPGGVVVTFLNDQSYGQQKASLVHAIGQRAWTHLAVQVSHCF